ncbi:glycoside hydrolase family 73 protein [Peptoniphilus catoniae]|uniref:glycoside hydrolase family 73 protein n=1 Tax=Peptoniphilus catoniae TaxID=1660341 RepID=UPI0010FEBAB8|nr:glucosaminidase domain-containing protein [Peptoniphilus catoniae]
MRKKEKNNLFFFFSGFIFIIIIFIVVFKSDGENKSEDFKESYLSETKVIAFKTARSFNLLPSVILAQSALESSFGSSKLSKDYNNYFGIKSKSKNGVKLDTVEYIDQEEKILSESFRVYKSKAESFTDYGRLITEAQRYEKVREARDYKEACRALQDGGYATDPSYADKIISIIEKYELYKLDEEMIN